MKSETHDAVLRANGRAQHDNVLNKVAAAMELLRKEIISNGGIYAKNNGKLTLKEFCDRAGISEGTIHHPNHRSKTRNRVHTFLSSVAKLAPPEVPHPQATRRSRRHDELSTLRENYRTLEKAYNNMARHYNLAEIRVVELTARVSLLESQLQAAGVTISQA